MTVSKPYTKMTVKPSAKIGVYLNSKDLTTYDALKKRVDSIATADEQSLAPFRQNGPGVRTMFCEVVAAAEKSGGGALMKDFI